MHPDYHFNVTVNTCHNSWVTKGRQSGAPRLSLQHNYWRLSWQLGYRSVTEWCTQNLTSILLSVFIMIAKLQSLQMCDRAVHPESHFSVTVDTCHNTNSQDKKKYDRMVHPRSHFYITGGTCYDSRATVRISLQHRCRWSHFIMFVMRAELQSVGKYYRVVHPQPDFNCCWCSSRQLGYSLKRSRQWGKIFASVYVGSVLTFADSVIACVCVCVCACVCVRVRAQKLNIGLSLPLANIQAYTHAYVLKFISTLFYMHKVQCE